MDNYYYENRISVIIPFYNSEKYIDACISNVTEQSYRNLEILLIDDGSTDNSSSIARKRADQDDRIIYIRQNNSGAASARNRGITAATGAWITFIDSDDAVTGDYIEIMIETAVTNDADIVECGYTDNKDTLGTCADLLQYCTSGREMLCSCRVTQVLWGKLYRKKLFDGIRIKEIPVHEDVATVYRLFYKAERTAKIENVLYYNQIRNDSLSLHGSFNKQELDRLDVIKEKINFFDKEGDHELSDIAIKEYVVNLLSMYPEYKKKYGDDKTLGKLRSDYRVMYKRARKIKSTRKFKLSLLAAWIVPEIWMKLAGKCF